MGNNSCQIQGKRSINDIASTYKMDYLQHIKDPYLGEIQLYKSADQYFFFVEKKFNNQPDYQQYLEQCEQQDFLNHNENLLKLQGYIPQKVDQLCSNYYQIILIYEYFYDNLLNEYNKKKHQQIRFDEHELWTIINSVCEVLKDIKQEHGELCLENIMIDRNGHLKVYNNHFLNRNNNMVGRYERSRIFKQKYLQNNSEQIYMDQLQFKSYDPDSTSSYLQLMENNNNYDNNQFQKKDVFSLGLICLQLLRLEKIVEIYDFDNFEINQGLIEQYIWEIEKEGIYSERMVEMVKRMTMMDEQDRPDVNQILDYANKMGNTNSRRINVFDMSQSRLIHQSQYVQQQNQMGQQQSQIMHQSRFVAGVSCINANLSRIEEVHEDKDKFITDSFLNMQEGNKNMPFYAAKKNSFVDASKNFDNNERNSQNNNEKHSFMDEQFDKEMQQKIQKQQQQFEQELSKLSKQQQQKQQELSVIQQQGHYIEQQSILQQQKDLSNTLNHKQPSNPKNINYIDPKVQLVIQQMKNQQYNTQGQTVMEQLNMYTINEIHENSEYQTVKDDKYMERENNPYFDKQQKLRTNNEMWKNKVNDNQYQKELNERMDQQRERTQSLEELQRKRMQLMQQYRNKVQ